MVGRSGVFFSPRPSLAPPKGTNVEQLLKFRAELLAKIKATNAKIDAFLAISAPTPEQAKAAEADNAEATSLYAELAKIDARIERKNIELAEEKRQKDMEAQAATERIRAEQANRGRRMTQPDLPAAGHTGASGVPAEPRQHDPRGGFANPRDFLLAVMDWGRGTRQDNRLRERLTVGSDEARNSSDPAGGFLTPEAFSPNMLRVSPESDPMAGLTTQIPMNFPVVKIPARVDKNHTTSVSGGFTVTRRPETVAGTPSQMTFERLALEAHELFGLTYATEEILTDSPQSFIAIIESGFSDQFTYHLINERLNGSGNGEFLGVMNSPCLVSVAKESGQSAATIVKENIDKMRSRCWRYGRAVWLANHDTLPMLKSLAQVVGVGGAPVPYLSVDANGNATLDGRPCIFTEYAKTLGTVGDLVLGVWSEYLEGTYQSIQAAESMHVRFINHERAFKFWVRNAGMPWWSAALTPKNSAATLSPFVVLATRA